MTNDGNDFYHVSAINSGMVLAVANGSVIRGNNVVQASYNAHSNAQKWALKRNPSDNSYTLVNKLTGLVLDISGAKYRKGQNVQAWTSNNSAVQVGPRWKSWTI